MKPNYYIISIFLALLLPPHFGQAQEEESAEVSMEAYTDDFQELFFEALKQKGIENYTKAINALLRCKGLQPANSVIDHELAKTYLLNNQLVLAEEYAIEAIQGEPDNLWFLNTLVEIRQRQGATLEGIKDRIPYGNVSLKQNLALIYVKEKAFENALSVLKELGSSPFSKNLMLRIQDSLAQESDKKEKAIETIEDIEENPLLQLTQELNDALVGKDFEALNMISEQALENYPSQPYFYYVKGMALNKLSQPREAISYLEMGLDYLLEGDDLATKFYQELAFAYSAIGDTTKANMYLSKVKNGS